jgi:Domain of unknown function (DUF4149)
VNRIPEDLQALAVTVWVGVLWSVGLMVAPTLFQFVADRVLAGSIAARLFTYTALVGMGCASYLLLFRLARFGSHAFRQAFFWVALAMLALTLVGQFGVRPIVEAVRQQALAAQVVEGVLRDRFATWHGVASVLYVAECVLGLVLTLLHTRVPN